MPQAIAFADEDLKRRERAQQRRRRKRQIKYVLLGLGVAAMAAVLIYALIPKPIPVDLGTAARRSMRVTVNEDGMTRAKNRYLLSAPLTGNMDRIPLLPGDPVEEGEPLLTIVPSAPPLLDARSRADAEARLAAAQAALQLAGAEVARASAALSEARRRHSQLEALASAGVAPSDEVEVAKFELRTRAEELRAARFSAKVRKQEEASARAALGLFDKKNLGKAEDLQLIAPVSGQVLRVLHEDQEGLVAAGTPLVEVADLALVEVIADILTADAVHIRPGARADIIRWGGDEALDAHVTRVEPSAFTRISALGVEEQRVFVVLEIDSPREMWSALGDGYRVEVEIETWSGHGVLSIPASAVFRHEDQWATYQILEGSAHLSPLVLGHRNDTQVEVLSGLREGARVIRHPSDRIVEGASVKARGK